MYAPLDGEVVEINNTAVDAPDLVNKSPYEDAWLVKIKISDPSQTANLMDPDTYDQFAEESAN